MFASFATLIRRYPRSLSVYENRVIQNNQIIYWVVSLVLVVSFDGLVLRQNSITYWFSSENRSFKTSKQHDILTSLPFKSNHTTSCYSGDLCFPEAFHLVSAPRDPEDAFFIHQSDEFVDRLMGDHPMKISRLSMKI